MNLTLSRRIGTCSLATASVLGAQTRAFSCWTPNASAQRAAAFSYSSSSVPYPLTHARRTFWNPFATFTKSNSPPLDTPEQRKADQHAKIVEEAHRDAEMQNERLLGACLDLLEMCGGDAAGSAPSDKLDHVAREHIWALVDVMLHGHRRTPAEQFDLVYAALCLPAAQETREVQRCLVVVLNSVLPEALYRVFESVDLYVAHDDEQSLRQREALTNFVHAMLGDLKAPQGVQDEEILAVYIDDVKAMFPALATCHAWTVVERDASIIALKAKLFTLLGRLCAEFDTDHSGKVKLEDLRATARRVLGEEQATQLLEGARPDKDGKIAYPQLTALLIRPPPKREVKNDK